MREPVEVVVHPGKVHEVQRSFQCGLVPAHSRFHRAQDKIFGVRQEAFVDVSEPEAIRTSPSKKGMMYSCSTSEAILIISTAEMS